MRNAIYKEKGRAIINEGSPFLNIFRVFLLSFFTRLLFEELLVNLIVDVEPSVFH